MSVNAELLRWEIKSAGYLISDSERKSLRGCSWGERVEVCIWCSSNYITEFAERVRWDGKETLVDGSYVEGSYEAPWMGGSETFEVEDMCKLKHGECLSSRVSVMESSGRVLVVVGCNDCRDRKAVVAVEEVVCDVVNLGGEVPVVDT